MNKIIAVLMVPIVLIAIPIDLMFGDAASGVKTTILEKLREHKRARMEG